MRSFRALVLPLLLTSASLSSGCKTEAYEQGTATGKTIQQAADEIDRSITALDATVLSLNNLVAENEAATDPAMQFKTFSKELETLESRAKSVRDLAAEMEKDSKSYLAKWDAEIAAIANEDIRERSQERRQKVDKTLAKISEEYADAREEFAPLLADLKDIRSALAADLTPDGIASMRRVAGKASDRSEDVKETLTELSERYRELGVGLGQSAMPASATKNP